MEQDARRMILDRLAHLRRWLAAILPATARAWSSVGAGEKRRLRQHGLALAGAAFLVLVPWWLGVGPAGPFVFVDGAIAVVAWFGGLSAGVFATLCALLVSRVAAEPLTGVPFDATLSILLGLKGIAVSVAVDALASRARRDRECLGELEALVQEMHEAARARKHELTSLAASSSEAHAKLRNEADVARLQLTTLQSVTDPALNTLHGPQLATALLERVRVALGADGVALYHPHGLQGRIIAASGGLQPRKEGGRYARPESSEYQMGRTALVHNDAARVLDTSLCGWPSEVTSLIVVPVVHSGRLQLVVEVANERARRSTEWELALIQVVAERAAGIVRQDLPISGNAVA